MLQLTLKRAGYDVDACGDGEEGLDRQRLHPADVIITDILMPVKEGLELIVEVKKEFPETRIIAISGGGKFGPKGYLFMADRLGADAAFSKPVDQNRLLNSVRALCEQQPVNT
ncbi:MAG: response regulator [Spartobacteria bacterium]|nr:response regulator [Spartobacteria bacterium]